MWALLLKLIINEYSLENLPSITCNTSQKHLFFDKNVIVFWGLQTLEGFKRCSQSNDRALVLDMDNQFVIILSM